MKKLFLLLAFAATAVFGQDVTTPISQYVGNFSGLPVNPAVNYLAVVVDGNGVNCLAGGGGTREWCQWNGTAWIFVGGTGGAGGGPTIQTNGINNASQSFLNFLTSSTNAVGLILSPSNPTTGNEDLEIGGTLNSTGGGTGRSNPTANSILLGEGASPVNLLSPGAVGTCLVSNGSGVDPSYQSCPAAAPPSYPYTVGGTVNSGGVPYFNTTTQTSSSAVLVGGQFVLGGGSGNPPYTSFSVVPSTNGGIGVATPTAHYVGIAEGSSPFTFISPSTSGYCLLSNGTSADPSFGSCPTANPAGATDSLQFNAGGGNFGALASPVTNGVYNVIYNVTGSGAVAPTAALPGVLPNPQTGLAYTYGGAYTNADRFGYTSFSNGSTVTATLPQAGTVGFTSNWGNLSCNIGTGQVNITPTTSTISYSNGTSYTPGASSLPLSTGDCAWIFSDNSNYFAVTTEGMVGAVVHGTATLGTGAIGSGACASAVTVSAAGVTTSSVIDWGLTGDPTGITGYAPSANGGLYIVAYPGSNTVSFKSCNNTQSSITPGSAVTLNWSVRTP